MAFRSNKSKFDFNQLFNSDYSESESESLEEKQPIKSKRKIKRKPTNKNSEIIVEYLTNKEREYDEKFKLFESKEDEFAKVLKDYKKKIKELFLENMELKKHNNLLIQQARND